MCHCSLEQTFLEASIGVALHRQVVLPHQIFWSSHLVDSENRESFLKALEYT